VYVLKLKQQPEGFPRKIVGEMVIIEGQNGLPDNAKVTIETEDEDEAPADEKGEKGDAGGKGGKGAKESNEK